MKSIQRLTCAVLLCLFIFTAVIALADQAGALRSAKQYLSVMPFSHDGLIEQLEYEGYSNSDATYAAFRILI